ncbi:hypothetical protein HDE_08969 [Halotydeus destructor]|nr:hypothetical protein HDE_08969 [Halotydeus destructor]
MADDTFSYVDALLFMFGIKIFCIDARIKLCNCIISFIVITATLYTFYDDYMYNADLSAVQLMRKVSIRVFPLTAHLIVAVKMSSLRQTINDIVQRIPLDQKRKIRNRSLIFVMAYATFSLFLFYINFYAWDYDYADEMSWYSISGEYVNVAIYCLTGKHWVITMSSLYCVVLASWSAASQHFMASAMMAGQLSEEQCITLMRKRQQFNNLKRRINQHFDWFPFLFFASLFIESAGVIMHVRKSIDLSNTEKLVVLSINLVCTMVTLIVAIVVHERDSEADRMYLAGTWKHLALVKDFNVRLSFRKTFSEEIPFTAILFVMNQTVFLGFLSSLISFTVMLIQFN